MPDTNGQLTIDESSGFNPTDVSAKLKALLTKVSGQINQNGGQTSQSGMPSSDPSGGIVSPQQGGSMTTPGQVPQPGPGAPGGRTPQGITATAPPPTTSGMPSPVGQFVPNSGRQPHQFEFGSKKAAQTATVYDTVNAMADIANKIEQKNTARKTKDAEALYAQFKNYYDQGNMEAAAFLFSDESKNGKKNRKMIKDVLGGIPEMPPEGMGFKQAHEKMQKQGQQPQGQSGQPQGQQQQPNKQPGQFGQAQLQQWFQEQAKQKRITNFEGMMASATQKGMDASAQVPAKIAVDRAAIDATPVTESQVKGSLLKEYNDGLKNGNLSSENKERLEKSLFPAKNVTASELKKDYMIAVDKDPKDRTPIEQSLVTHGATVLGFGKEKSDKWDMFINAASKNLGFVDAQGKPDPSKLSYKELEKISQDASDTNPEMRELATGFLKIRKDMLVEKKANIEKLIPDVAKQLNDGTMTLSAFDKTFSYDRDLGPYAKEVILPAAIKLGFNPANAESDERYANDPKLRLNITNMNNILKQLDVVDKAGQKLWRLPVQELNKILSGGNKQFGQEDIVTFNAARGNLIRVMAGIGNTGFAAKEKIQMLKDEISNAQTNGQLKAAITTFKKAVKDQKESELGGKYLRAYLPKEIVDDPKSDSQDQSMQQSGSSTNPIIVTPEDMNK